MGYETLAASDLLIFEVPSARSDAIARLIATRWSVSLSTSAEWNFDCPLIINGQSNFNSAEVDSETDHRVSMSLAIASLLAKGTSKIKGADAASVSYPAFWEDLAKLTN